MNIFKKNSYLSVLLLVPFLFTGCLWNTGKTKIEPRRKVKHITLQDKTREISLKKTSTQSPTAFVLEDDEDELLNPSRNVVKKRVTDSELSHSDAGWVAERDASNKEFETVVFDFNSSKIRSDQREKLLYDVERAKNIVDKENAVIVSGGHADSQFLSKEYNIAKSEERARRGKEALLQVGVPEENIRVIAYGDTQRCVNVPGKCEENRRLEFTKVVRTDNAV